MKTFNMSLTDITLYHTRFALVIRVILVILALAIN